MIPKAVPPLPSDFILSHWRYVSLALTITGQYDPLRTRGYEFFGQNEEVSLPAFSKKTPLLMTTKLCSRVFRHFKTDPVPYSVLILTAGKLATCVR